MSSYRKSPPLPVELARLRAAADLIPIIESGLEQSRLDVERVALMCEFCSWASRHSLGNDEHAIRLTGIIKDGLERIRGTLGLWPEH
jgi:hypothetical protein